MSVPRLTVLIDPRLTSYRPEIDWTLRTVLSIMGWAWEEVSPGRPCDIAYVLDPASSNARLAVAANLEHWAHRDQLRLAGIGRGDGPAYLKFVGSRVGDADPCRRTSSQLVCTYDFFFDVFWMATGQEEPHWPRGRHGFIDLTGSVALRDQVFLQATASAFGVWLQAALLDLGCQAGVPRWPGGRAAAAAISHDVDYPEVKRWLEPARILMRQGTRGLPSALRVAAGVKHHWQFAPWMAFEASLRARSAFYFVARCGSLLEYATGTPDSFYDIGTPRFRDLFRVLADGGIEIGLHASYRAYQSLELFKAEKEKLEECSGQAVLGNRHHYLHLNPTDPEETLRFHEKIGFRYDATLFHNSYLGFRRGLSHPFFPFHQRDRSDIRTLQIPTAWMDDQVFGFKSHNPGERHALLRTIADSVAEQGGCLLVNVHDYVFDQDLFPGWTTTLERLWTHVLQRGDFWFATPREIANHWTTRQSMLMAASAGLSGRPRPAT